MHNRSITGPEGCVNLHHLDGLDQVAVYPRFLDNVVSHQFVPFKIIA
ncbi:hypothetical protein ACZ87_01464 [Candidatus Erwinia dacicola]|uniref:Uncharacterized protein n=1 Tax=Candidatus Erwinia dacicola TaxID=252393 RepID=A0A328TMA2_9GAMM|nr:hypothetical protein ACZ87_01464 [Candidatus Erwinia dacicola]